MKYRDLQFQRAHISDTQKEFKRVHLGSRAPSDSELKALVTEFAKVAKNLDVLYVGMTGVAEARPNASAQHNNAIILLFTSKASLQNFLNQPIAPTMKGISLVLDVTAPPRL
jgi:hypothetical protein